MVKYLALELTRTIRHDGHGGVADDLTEVDGLTSWVHEHAVLLGGWAGEFAADETIRSEVVELRQAVRVLFAHAVRPGPPSPADAHRLLPLEQALSRVNTAAGRVPITPQLDWPARGEPATRVRTVGSGPAAELLAALARSTIDLLASPLHRQLRACTAPRCVRYFIQEHGRQEFCKPSCSNRARAARHYQRHRPALETGQKSAGVSGAHPDRPR